MKANNIYLKISQRGYKLDLNRHLNSLSKNIKKTIMTKKRPRRERKRKKNDKRRREKHAYKAHMLGKRPLKKDTNSSFFNLSLS